MAAAVAPPPQPAVTGAALLLAVPRLAAQAPFPGDDLPALCRQVQRLTALAPERGAALVGPRGWEARALLPDGWAALEDVAALAAWAGDLHELTVAAVVRPGIERWSHLDMARIESLTPRRWSPLPMPGDAWLRRVDLGAGVTCLRESLALLAPALDTDWVNAYLLSGSDGELLIDCGCGVVDYAACLGRQPRDTVLTHGDWDHAGGRAALDRVHCHPLDFPALRRRQPEALLRQGLARLGRPEAERFALPRDCTGILPLHDGQRFDLGGGTSLEVLHLPGHTPGEVALWDAAGGRLFAGDAAYVGPLYVTDATAFAASTEHLARLPGVAAVLGGHGPVPAPPQLLGELSRAAAAVRDGRCGPGVERGAFVEHRFERFSLVLPRGLAPGVAGAG